MTGSCPQALSAVLDPYQECSLRGIVTTEILYLKKDESQAEFKRVKNFSTKGIQSAMKTGINFTKITWKARGD